MESPYDTSEKLLGRLGLKSAAVLGEEPLALLSRALVDKDNHLAFYVNPAGQLAAGDGTVVLAGNAVVDFVPAANAAARLALTRATVRNGDHVQDTDTGSIYELVEDTAIANPSSWVKIKNIVSADVVDATSTGRAVLTAGDSAAAAAGLGAIGEILVWLHFGTTGLADDERLYASVSADGDTWYRLNSGAPVYQGPSWAPGAGQDLVRDVSTWHHAASGYFYATFTAGTYGLSGYFRVIRSRDLIHWSHVKDVDTSAVSPAPSGLTWGPQWIEDASGGIHIIVALAASNVEALQLYELHPVTSDLGGAWSAPAAVTMPANDGGYNDPWLVRSPDDGLYHMLVLSYNVTDNAATIHLTASSLLGPWTRTHSLGHDSFEGIGAVRVGPKRWKWFMENWGQNNGGYRYWLLDENFQILGGPEFVTESEATPNAKNGDMIWLRSPLAATLANGNASLGGLAKQFPNAVAITGGTVNGVSMNDLQSVTLAPGYSLDVGAHTAWTGGGVKMWDYGRTHYSILGMAADAIYWGLPTANGGMHLVNGARTVEVFTFTDAGAFTAAGSVTAHGALKAKGGAVEVRPHAGFTGGGLISRTADDSGECMVFGTGYDNNGYWGLPTGGGGMSIWSDARTGEVAKITNLGGFQMLSLKVGSTSGALGTLINGLRHGTATLSGGTVTVADTSVTANCRILVNRLTDGGTVGDSYSVSRSAGASFTITSKSAGATQTADSSVVAWFAVEP